MNVLRTLTLILLLPISAWAAEYSDPSVWARTIGSFNLEDEIIGPRAGDIVATGSSSMLFWDHRIHADLAPLTIISRGFGGSNMNDVLNYLDQLVLKHKPRAVLIYEGDNEGEEKDHEDENHDEDEDARQRTRVRTRLDADDDLSLTERAGRRPQLQRVVC